MEETKKALDAMLANIFTVIGSSKFWITVAAMIVAVVGALNLQDPIWKAILAIIGVLTGGGYVASKTYQNTHGANDPAVITTLIEQTTFETENKTLAGGTNA